MLLSFATLVFDFLLLTTSEFSSFDRLRLTFCVATSNRSGRAVEVREQMAGGRIACILRHNDY